MTTENYRYKVFELISFDLYRDGGSMSMSYKVMGCDITFELIFPIIHTGNRIYGNPLIELMIPTIYKCTMTGQEIPDSLRYTVKSNWKEAIYILQQAEELIPITQPNYIVIHKLILEIINKHFAQQGDRPEPVSGHNQ